MLSRLKRARLASSGRHLAGLAVARICLGAAYLPWLLRVPERVCPHLRSGCLAHHPFDLAWSPPRVRPTTCCAADGLCLTWLRSCRAPSACRPFPDQVGPWLSIMAGALGIFGWTRRRFGPWPALLAEFVYTLWPFGLLTLFTRGALAETVLLGLMPLALWAADAACDARPRFQRRPGSAAGRRALDPTGLALWFARSS